MKSDIRIKIDIYRFIKGSTLEGMVNGKLTYRKRPKGSDKEDIIISVLANKNGQIQDAIVNVNIYVKDDLIDGQYEEASARIDEIAAEAESFLDHGIGNGFRFVLDSQHVEEVKDLNQHFINNKLVYSNNTEEV